MLHRQGTVEIKTTRTLLRKMTMEDAKTLFTYGDWGETQAETDRSGSSGHSLSVLEARDFLAI